MKDWAWVPWAIAACAVLVNVYLGTGSLRNSVRAGRHSQAKDYVELARNEFTKSVALSEANVKLELKDLTALIKDLDSRVGKVGDTAAATNVGLAELSAKVDANAAETVQHISREINGLQSAVQDALNGLATEAKVTVPRLPAVPSQTPVQREVPAAKTTPIEPA